ncbi:MAG: hypothetical protein OEZ06_04555 [Myxococcales bacterium]|nr:hypothetical protein [Myxococcales bacterium]
MTYTGQDRRVHKVFVTRNTEYHLRRDTCVRVRDRQSGRWMDGHFAVNREVAGAIRFFESGALSAQPGLPQVGESLYFEDAGHDLVTSSIVSVERPRRDVVDQYPC